MEIYFKLSFKVHVGETAVSRIRKILFAMAKEEREIQNGKPIDGAWVEWFRNPVEGLGIHEVMEYYKIGYGRKIVAYVIGKDGDCDNRPSLYSVMKKVIKRHLDEVYDNKSFLRCLRRTIKKTAAYIDKEIKKEQEQEQDEQKPRG